MTEKWKKINIILSIVLVMLLAINVYVFAFRGAVSKYRREQLDIFIPRFSANEYIDESSLTDSITFHRFKLNRKENEQIKANIENNDAWHKFSENDKDLIEAFPENSDTYDALKRIDFTACFIAVYDLRNDCFTADYDGILSFVAAVYDEENSMYYYFEMIW